MPKGSNYINLAQKWNLAEINDKPAMFSQSLQKLYAVVSKHQNKDNNEYSTKRWAVMSVFLNFRKQYHIESSFHSEG